MNILITGVAGFIGFNLAKCLLNKKYKIYGIDNFDSYYSILLKKKRLNNLKKNKRFVFSQLDLTDKKKTNIFFKNKKFDLIINLAAQAGVRYSLINPKKYIDTNIFGFLNLIEQANKHKIKKIMYASSSSVYGENTNFPLKESEELNPKNIYAVSKKLNEEIAETYHKISKINFIGLRFFTIYGEWGRPDMFMFKLFKAFFLKKTFYLNNYGNHLRDFTYIDDATNIIEKLIKKKIIGNSVFNICSNKPQNILKIVQKFNKKNKTKIKMISINKADVLKTHGCNNKIKKFINYKKFSNFEIFFEKTFKWYKNNKIYNIK
jgi:UDP-glucuronate 4-epimerase